MTGREWWREAEAEPEPTVPPRLPGEALYSYLERIAVAAGWMAPIRGVQRKGTGRERIPGEEG